MTKDTPLWTPSLQDVQAANITHFQAYLTEKKLISAPFSTYKELHHWSITNRRVFWKSLFDYFQICYEGSTEPAELVQTEMINTRWFPNVRLNFAENLLRRDDNKPAVVSILENGQRKELSFQELKEKVRQLQHSLLEMGVQEGDRIVAFMPNIPETLIAMLATVSLGAIWSSCSPDFGINGVIDRFGQIKPKVLFCCDGYYYNGKTIQCFDKLKQISAQLPELEQIVITPLIGETNCAQQLNQHTPSPYFEEFLSSDKEHTLQFKRLPFNHPPYIMYSSGTTGLPKCIVHGAGGTLLQHLKELSLHTNVKRDDTIFYYTTCGWMMWNWLVSSLALGAKLVLFDGSPFHPKPSSLIDLIDKEQINTFGCSAKYISALEKADVKPKQSHQLKSLRNILSTGSPLNPANFQYIYREFKQELCLSSISGGTDIISCFVLGNPVLPVYSGEIQCAGLAMDVNIFNEQGKPIIGEKGELVCTQAFPSMPIYFWDDPDNKRYHASYFHHFSNIWTHGDYGEETPHGGFIISGRSDTVLNPGGIRIGTAEIYRIVESIPKILDSVVVGQSWKGDVRVVLFVQLKTGLNLDEILQKEIKQTIRKELSPRHTPEKILQVTDIPKTLSGKTVELAVSHSIHGRCVENLDALANPEALKEYKNRQELKD
ncbi:MAG: acetoacetate--CoA ligase [Pseudomonadales bacterium]|nr:acetoacetate--CoA ligase [Pseudomonadales bacterium]